MSGGLFALLDDVAVLAKAAAASVDDVAAAAARASVKATGVVVDDTAVTPRYVHGLAAERELPIIKKIATGSIRNKLLIILPVALLLSQFLPVALTPILMLGGTYLSFEGAEKIWELVARGGEHTEAAAGPAKPVAESQIVSNAVRTDLILSAEIMVISLNEVADEPFLSRAVILVVVAFLITLLVYGVVALIVKMDDVGLALAERGEGITASIGRGLVAGMPKVLSTLSTVGIAAMLWVGGHIILVGLDELGVSGPYSLVHHAETAIAHATGIAGGLLGWLTNTVLAAVAGLVIGAVVVLVMHLLPRRHPATH
ncbi:MAG: DUF808 domain-containing protein [Nostocoides sp.]